MSSLVDLPELVGFFSYSREDDEGSDGALSALREAIQRELSAQLGRSRTDFRVWQDKAAISHGTLWEKEIKVGIAQSVFFIPIITPRAVKSQHCVFEFESFLAREAELGRDDLVFPILYIPVPALEDENLWRKNPVLKIVGTRQYLDWRNLRHQNFGSTDVRMRVEDFCRNIASALRKNDVPHARRRETAALDATFASASGNHFVGEVQAPKETPPPREEADRIPVASWLTYLEPLRRWPLPPRWPIFVAGSIALFFAGAVIVWLKSTPQLPAPRQSSALASFVPLTLEREQALRPKDRFKECPTCPEMVVVPAGSFIMGSPPSEPGRRDNEGPQHKVTLARPFAVGRFAVTFDEWEACLAAGGCNSYWPADSGWGRNRRPVIDVDWDDAKSYATWLSKATGKGYRLLSEAEREYATRAGSSTIFSFGDDPAELGQYAWYLANAGAQTHPVGEKIPNAFGLYDIQGNVWDWTEDCLNPNYSGAPTDGSAWMSGDCTNHVLRGGSWYQNPEALRAARRGWQITAHRVNNFGFRIARTLSVAPETNPAVPAAH